MKIGGGERGEGGPLVLGEGGSQFKGPGALCANKRNLERGGGVCAQTFP